jgi:endo-cleaving rubber dioxygenase
MLTARRYLCAIVFSQFLVACGGGSSGGGVQSGDGVTPGDNDNSGSTTDPQTFFQQDISSSTDFCRTCHIPGGVADVADGRALMLSNNVAEDYSNFYSAWQALGGGVESSPLLREPADPAEPHSGGKPWPVGGAVYESMRTLLNCWENPTACNLQSDGGDPVAELPLLRSSRGSHVWADFCADQPDSALLPADPRELVQPGVNGNRNVVFNIDWRSCDTNEIQRPANCGEYRSLVSEGELVAKGQGQPGTAHMFSANGYQSMDFTDPTTWMEGGSFFTIPAEAYNRLWQTWSGYILRPALPARPENFDELIAQRYGSVLGSERNPYPLPGEDPNQTNGGSGQLPVAFTQLREPDGTWTGNIGVKLCSFCHDGQVVSNRAPGMNEVFGGGGTIGDFTVAFRDFAAVGLNPAFGLLSGLVTVAPNRGTGAIDQFQVGFIAFNGGTFEEYTNDKIILSQAIGVIKSPPWWNMGHRVQKFHGAVLPVDSSRIDMAAYTPLLPAQLGDIEATTEWVDEASYAFQLWAESLKAPEYPGQINTDLAEQGAILFHSKNLWAEGLNNPEPEPQNPGNGSCASCHGVYSPRFANDPAFLVDPGLTGVAANLISTEYINTDPVYADAMQSLRNPDGSPARGSDNVPFLNCGLGDFSQTENNAPVILAPPLYGVWASAPYLHNASVPNVWQLLSSAESRPNIWVRHSAPAPEGLEGSVVMGFDTNFDRAYDEQKMGWKYDELDCVSNFLQTQPLLACNPIAPDLPTLQDLLGVLYSQVALLWNLPIDDLANVPFTDQQVENRKVYNTNMYSQGNQGHEFTAVLTDAERAAIIEYLKTL